ncbi:uracil-DNA glycosylase, partial [Mesorhizobium sp. M4A.F.Ca.ET.020.02.1.1]
MVAATSPEPGRDCPLCPRLHDFIADWRQREPTWFNAPVPPVGDEIMQPRA